jgi:hypothetical protein
MHHYQGLTQLQRSVGESHKSSETRFADSSHLTKVD